MKFKLAKPTLVIGRNNIDKINTNYLIANQNLITRAFANAYFIDINGVYFKCLGVKQSGGIDLFNSIKFLGKMVYVEPIIHTKGQFALTELKNIILEVYNRNKADFSGITRGNDFRTELLNIRSCLS